MTSQVRRTQTSFYEKNAQVWIELAMLFDYALFTAPFVPLVDIEHKMNE